MFRTKSLDFETVIVASPRDVEFKSTPDGVIGGWASVFNDAPDAHRDVILPGAFTKSLAGFQAQQRQPAMLWSHQQEEPIGRWTSVAEDTRGLRVEGQLNLKSRRGADAFEHIKAGDADGLSIGFRVPSGGRTFEANGVTRLKQIDLFEISVVAMPAQSSARILSVKSLTSKGALIDLLREAGLAKTAATRIAAGGWPALAGEDQTKAINLAAQIDRAIASMKGLSK